MKYYLLSIMPALLFLSGGCNQVAEQQSTTNQLEQRIAQGIAAGPRQDTTFMGLRYGEHHSSSWGKLLAKIESGELLDGNSGPKYRFTEPSSLAYVDWMVIPSFLNDSLQKVTLQYSDQNVSQYYEPLLEKYALIYGNPIRLEEKEAAFVRGEQLITVRILDISSTLGGIITVSYDNSRRAKRYLNLSGQLIKDDRSSEYDSAYYKKHIIPRLKMNPDGI